MSEYRVRILDSASRELQSLDRQVALRILRRIKWLAANLNVLRPQPLTGEFAGLFKLRVGDYRVIYEVLKDEKLIVVHAVGYRREIYRG